MYMQVCLVICYGVFGIILFFDFKDYIYGVDFKVYLDIWWFFELGIQRGIIFMGKGDFFILGYLLIGNYCRIIFYKVLWYIL